MGGGGGGGGGGAFEGGSIWFSGGGERGESVEYFRTSGALRKFYYDTTKIL